MSAPPSRRRRRCLSPRVLHQSRRSARLRIPPSSPSTTPISPSPSPNNKISIQQSIKNHIKILSKQHEMSDDNNMLPPLHRIPCASIVSFNPTSLSHYTNNQTNINNVISKFSKKCDVIFLQETKLLANDKQALKSILTNHEVYYSNNLHNTGPNATSHTAGICTAVSKKISSKYDIKTLKLPSSLQGHALVLFISLPDSDFSLKLINLRLVTPPCNKTEAQETMISDLHAALTPHPSKFTIVGGDFNFVEHAQDTTSDFKSVQRPAWDNFKKDLKLSECISDLHSFFHIPGAAVEDKNQKSWSARLDRFYISHTEADLTIVKPVVTSDVHTIPPLGERGFNSHVPTSLHFFLRKKVMKGPRRISENIVANEKFVPYTKNFWNQHLINSPDANPVEKLRLFGDSMREASKKIFIEHKNEINMVIVFQKAVALYRYLSSGEPNDAEVLRITDNTPLLTLVSFVNGEWCTTKLKSFIDKSFKVAGVPEGEEMDTHSELEVDPVQFSPTPKNKPNALNELKLKLPSTRTKVQALRAGPDFAPSSSPTVIGPIIKKHYGNLWSAVDTGPNRHNELRDYLEDYDRRIDPKEITECSLELVEKAIRMAPATSPGPDGVPFSAFKANIELAAPIILDVCHFLGVERGAEALGSFNNAILFLLPKKETHDVADTRPISVNNAGNRIVARVLFLAVAEASQKLIGDYQRMFLPGRRMIDHLRDLNTNYYDKVQANLDYFILFMDNAKAFDSIHHDFILATLAKQGFPRWFINAVSNLLTAVYVSPSLAPDFVISIKRGVKQGCPLSPLLFILCYDVLNFKLSPLENIKVKAAADDLAVESDNLGDVIRTFPVIDDFTIASGLGVNRDKTVILSAKDSHSRSFAPAIRKIQNSKWPLVKFADSHKYLGILFGRSIQVEDIYAAPAKKALDRARSFGAAISRMDTQRRILTFNVFITPIFSFVQQFYVMPSSVLREYRRIMHRAISPYAGSAWPYSQLCAPTNLVGFKQPLRDPWVYNATIILKNHDFSSISSELDLPWNLDGSLRNRSRRATNWDSPVFRTHSELQLMEFLGADYLNWNGSSALPKLDATAIKKHVTQNLVVSYSVGNSAAYTRNFGKDHLSHLRDRCKKYGIPAVNLIIEHYANLPKQTPAFLLSHFIKLFSGSLNLDGGRRRYFDPNGSVHLSKNSLNPFPCYLCGEGDASLPGDNEKHIFLRCSCVKSAWIDVLLHPSGPCDGEWYSTTTSKTTPLFITDYPLADANQGYNRLALVISFCWAIYKTISQIKMGRSATGACARAVSLTMSLRKIWTSAKNRKRKR